MIPPFLGDEAYDRRRDAMAERIFPFLKAMVKQGRMRPATYDRDAVVLILDAFRSRRFMELVEQDPDLNYDLKVQIASGNTSLNKSWPAVRRLIYSDKSDEIASTGLAIVEHILRVLEVCGVDYLPEKEDGSGEAAAGE
jgi:hypothetical protein